MRHVVGERAKDKTAASVSQMGRFETEILTQPQNLEVLMSQLGQWVDEVHQCKPIKEIMCGNCPFHISMEAVVGLRGILEDIAGDIVYSAVEEFTKLNKAREKQGLPRLKRLNFFAIKKASEKFLKHTDDNKLGIQSTGIVGPGGNEMLQHPKATKPVKTTTDYKDKEVV